MITQSINLNLIPGSVPPRIAISQYDKGSRVLTITLYNGAVAFTQTGITAKIRGTKPDMKGFSYDATYSAGVVTADLTEQMSCVAGVVTCEVVLFKNDEVLGSGNFVLDVEAAALADGVDISETVLPEYISGAQAAAEAAADSADDAADSATAAAGSADAAAASAAIAEAAELNPPYIGANGNWWVYDTSIRVYKDSGVDASITVTVADVTMLDPGATPYVTNTGTSTDPIFHLFIPRGTKGDKGDKGDTGATGNGIASIEKTGASGLVDTYTITYTNGQTATFQVTNGASATLPAGGTTGQALIKDSDADSDASWHDVDIPAATASTAGKVKPDGTTTTVDKNGVISAKQTPVATASTAGKVKPDGNTITIDPDGTIHGANSTPIATVSVAGKVKPDGATITIDQDGTIHAAPSGGVPVGDVSGAAISVTNEVATLTWSDPSDVVIDGTTIAAWAGTKLVRKVGSAPTSPTDGTLIVNSTTRNQYSLTGIQDNTIEYGNTYYYRFFPYTTRNVVTDGSSVTATPTRTIIPLPSQSGTVVYNGTAQTATFSDYDSDKETVTGNTGTNAGTYTASFTPKHDYMWSDGTTTAKTVQWVIDKKPLTVPTVTGSFAYDGTQKSATISSFDTNEITQSGNATGTNAGTYTVLFDLVDSSNMEWSDHTTEQKSVDWTIAKAAGGATLSSDSVALNPDHPSVSVSISDATGAVSGVSSSDTGICTATLNNNVVTIANVNQAGGSATVTVSIAASENYEAATAEIEVTAAFTSVYGAEWDGTSTTAWSRTDDAAGFVDPVPALSNGNGSSPFDTLMPWAGMTKEERTGGTMVRIPKFWYKITQNGLGMKIQIADGPKEGFSVSPAHMDRGDGKGERDVVYVGRYHCGATEFKSVSGQNPKNQVTRSSARSSIHNLGKNIWQMDFATRFTLWLLYIVEFADWNTQAKIGYGCGNNSGVQAMGYTDNMQYHTGTTQVSKTAYGLGTQYRNIEGLWDNVYDWLDGCYYNSNGLNIVLNPANFSDSSGGTAVGTPSSGYPSKFEKKDVSGAFPMFIPTEANGSDSTYSCDYWNFYASNPCLCAGGYYDQYLGHGLFCVYYTSATSAGADRGCRLLELP